MNLITHFSSHKLCNEKCISRLIVLNNLVDRLIGNIDFRSLTFDIQDISNLSIYDIDTVMQMIPADTANTIHSIGSKFVHEGISWMNTIITNNRALETTELEPSTIYYMEKVMRKYIFTNREKIKRDAKIKSKIINILSFMVTKGSVKGYLLREETV